MANEIAIWDNNWKQTGDLTISHNSFPLFWKRGPARKHNFLYASRNTTLRPNCASSFLPLCSITWYRFMSSYLFPSFVFCLLVFPSLTVNRRHTSFLEMGNRQPLLSWKLQKRALMQIAKQIPFSSRLWDRYQEQRDMGGLASNYQLCPGSISCKEWRRLDWLERSCIKKSQFSL